MDRVDEDQVMDAAIERLLAVVEDTKPVGKHRPRTGTAGLVRRLYDRIEEWQREGYTYAEIVAAMEKAAVPIAGLNADRLGSAVRREKKRREESCAIEQPKPEQLPDRVRSFHERRQRRR